MHAIAYDLDLAIDAAGTTVTGTACVRASRTTATRIHAAIAPTGTPILRADDADDGAAYVYSLFVPAEASRLFPCIDRPDAKAVFTLRLALPAGWTAVSCGAGTPTRDGMTFAPTPPLPTYAFGFAAGPFAIVEDPSGAPPMRAYVRRSQAARLAADARAALKLSRTAIDWGTRFFGQPFPFAKHDLVVIPGFPFGGMEHAGATFLDEAAVAIGAQATEGARRRRAQLVFHETVHQWLGDCVTMRGFDDLWLKEGFANLGAALCAEASDASLQPWLGFHRLKQAAVREDASSAPVAVRQPVAHPDDAKALYGPAVYGKAPAVLRQARHLLGAERFDEGVRALVAAHAYGNVGLEDLAAALDASGGWPMLAWLREWLERPGTPTVRLEIDARHGRVAEARIVQHDASGAGRRWTQRLRAVAIDSDGRARSTDLVLDGASVVIDAWRGAPVPRIAFANAGDFGYGRFLLDERTRAAALEDLGCVRDALLRLQLVEALWEHVREADLAPGAFIDFALRGLAAEEEWEVRVALVEHAHTAAARYVSSASRTAARPALAAARQALGLIRPAPQDPAARALLALASSADPADKARCFALLRDDTTQAERAVEAAAERFNDIEHQAVTLPYLRAALEALPELARSRRIFFVDRWLASFCGGHTSRAALSIVRSVLAATALPAGLRTKVLRHADELARTVRIRERYGDDA